MHSGMGTTIRGVSSVKVLTIRIDTYSAIMLDKEIESLKNIL